MKYLAIIQARTGSTRMPNKVLLEVDRRPLLEYELMRVGRAKKIDKTVVATTTNEKDTAICKLCEQLGVDCFRGSENDVLDRYFRCAEQYPEYETIIRITGDCPLIDPVVIDETIEFYESGSFDYVNNHEEGKETFPDGMDVEIFTREALVEAADKASLPSEREHVTPYITKQAKFRKGFYKAARDYSQIRLTVDEPEDFELVKFLIENSQPETPYLEYVSILETHPEIMAKNADIQRNEGYLESLQQDLKENSDEAQV